MITLHHLHQSRSFRIAWLMEELGMPYDLVCHDRAADGTSGETLRAVHLLGRAPVVFDGPTVLFECGAVMEYVIHRYGQGRLSVPPHHLDYAAYLQWLHAAEGTCMVALTPIMRHAVMFGPAPGEAEHRMLEAALHVSDDALAGRQWFGGEGFSAADIMMETFLVRAQRFAAPAFAVRERLGAFLARAHARAGYARAKEVTEVSRTP